MLWDWVRAGGALYCDLGIGSWQSGGFQAFTEPLITLLGVLRVGYVLPAEFDGTVYMESPSLPSLREGMETRGKPFRGLMGDARVTAGAKPVVVFRTRRDPRRNRELLYSGIMVNDLGEGAVVYSTTPCLDDWYPDSPLGERFWGDLLSRGAIVEQLSSPGVRGGALDVRAGEGIAVIANYGPGPEVVRLRLTDVPAVVLTDCLVHTGRDLPHTEVLGQVPGGGLLAARDLPLEVLNPEALVAVHEYGPDGLSLTIGPPDAEYGYTLTRGGWIAGGTPIEYGFRLTSGELPILPNEELDLIVTIPGGAVTSGRVVADDAGVVTVLVDTAPAAEITLRPRAPEEVDLP
jgi:hypothetical protein